MIVEKHGRLSVARDDLIPGGTKARVLPRFLDAIGAGAEVVYASPAYGYAQVALAHSCAATGRVASVFVAKRKIPHRLTLEAASVGARIVQVPYGYLSTVQRRASDYCAATGATLMPFGLDDPLFGDLLARSIADENLGPFDSVWCAAGSGTLARALARVWPGAAVHAVAVGARPTLAEGTLCIAAPEPFERPARVIPPFPSCPNYDAKVWAWASAYAESQVGGHLMWNVAA